MPGDNIFGVEEVQQLLDQVGKAPARVMTTSTKKAARIALNYAKAHVYDGFMEQTGDLKRSLRIKKERRRKGKSVYTVGPDASGWYAHFLDYGWWATGGKKLIRGTSLVRKIRRGLQTKGMTWVPGNRFLRDSVDKNRDEIQTTILQTMGEELDKLR